MQEELNYWKDLWSDLSLRFVRPAEEREREADPWRKRASRFDDSTKRRQREGPDPLMEAVARQVLPTDTVVDIGAGTGRWAIFLAGLASSVTALDASPAMLEILERNVAAAGVTNVASVRGEWVGADVASHDVALSSHSMYATPDLVGFAHKMERVARRMCALVIRVPTPDGAIGDLALRIHGEWHDSPNFTIAYNILQGIGISPSVVMEPEVVRWSDDTFEAAVARAKRHLRLNGDEHDDTVREVLRLRLVEEGGRWIWPDGKRSALAWWRPPGA